jgi:hypothetical protein
MIDDECGEVSWMSGKGNWSTRKKPAPLPLRSPQIPHDVTQGLEPGPPRWEASDGTALGHLYLNIKYARRHHIGSFRVTGNASTALFVFKTCKIVSLIGCEHNIQKESASKAIIYSGYFHDSCRRHSAKSRNRSLRQSTASRLMIILSSAARERAVCRLLRAWNAVTASSADYEALGCVLLEHETLQSSS